MPTPGPATGRGNESVGTCDMTDTTTVDGELTQPQSDASPVPAEAEELGAQPARLATLLLVLAAMTILGGSFLPWGARAMA